MIFTPAPLADAWLIDLDPRNDARGLFVRTYCKNEFSAQGLNTSWVQTNSSYSQLSGTLRGLHYQRGPFAEVKIVRCVRGAVHDVIVDLRSSSPTCHQWLAVTLTADRPMWLYVPQGFAHGFLTLTPDVEMTYMVSNFYAPEAQGGVRYNDPHFNISWPREVDVISRQDQAWPDFNPATGDPLVGGPE